MIAEMLLVLAACVGARQSSDSPVPAAATSAPRDAAATARLRDSWREAIELDVPSEILANGTWIESSSDADPELVALFARALASAGLADRAQALLGKNSASPIALARARLALDRDELEAAVRELAPPTHSATWPTRRRFARRHPSPARRTTAAILRGRSENCSLRNRRHSRRRGGDGRAASATDELPC